jgi:hypothetical protein
MENKNSKLITNQDAFVSEIMKNIMPDSSGMSFLVGDLSQCKIVINMGKL